MSSSLMAQSTAGGKQACSVWGGAASVEFAVSLVPPLRSLPGFQPRRWCCLGCLNMTYGEICWRYAIRWMWHLQEQSCFLWLITPQIVMAEVVCAGRAGRRRVGVTAVQAAALLSDSHVIPSAHCCLFQVKLLHSFPAWTSVVTHLPVNWAETP